MFARALVLGLAMGAASVVPVMFRDGDFAGARVAPMDLERVVPREFGLWHEMAAAVLVVNPQSKELIDKLYSQVLTRSYVNSSGHVIMLTIAYGNDQRGNLEVHKPEVCYPAQGFTVYQNVTGSLATSSGSISVRRLETSMGPRKEPVTYWSTLAGGVVENRIQKRVSELKSTLAGRVPDGLLVRVSSIDPDTAHAWQVHQAFVDALLQSLPDAERARIAGLSTN
jgi:EpsI family protein